MANVVTEESMLRGAIYDAILAISLLLIFGSFFLLKRIRSLTWIGLIALPSISIICLLDALLDLWILPDLFKVVLLVLLAYFPARFLITFFLPGRVVHGGRIQDILWYLLVFILMAAQFFFEPAVNIIFDYYFYHDIVQFSDLRHRIGLMRFLPFVTLALIPILLTHDILAGRAKNRWRLIPDGFIQSRLFKPVFGKKQ